MLADLFILALLSLSVFLRLQTRLSKQLNQASSKRVVEVTRSQLNSEFLHLGCFASLLQNLDDLELESTVVNRMTSLKCDFLLPCHEHVI